jgi:hypothetical protein
MFIINDEKIRQEKAACGKVKCQGVLLNFSFFQCVFDMKGPNALMEGNSRETDKIFFSIYKQ